MFDKVMKLFKKHGLIISIAAAVVAVSIGCGAVLAFMSAGTKGTTNKFVAAKVDVKVVEEYENNIKSSIKAQNEGTCSAYMRLKVVPYRVNEHDQRIGGSATIPEFELGNDWIDAGDGTYIYKKSVEAGGTTGDLIKSGTDGMVLVEYDDMDGGKQAVEIIAEAIQAQPAEAASSSWNVTIVGGVITSVKAD